MIHCHDRTGVFPALFLHAAGKEQIRIFTHSHIICSRGIFKYGSLAVFQKKASVRVRRMQFPVRFPAFLSVVFQAVFQAGAGLLPGFLLLFHSENELLILSAVRYLPLGLLAHNQRTAGTEPYAYGISCHTGLCLCLDAFTVEGTAVIGIPGFPAVRGSLHVQKNTHAVSSFQLPGSFLPAPAQIRRYGPDF